MIDNKPTVTELQQTKNGSEEGTILKNAEQKPRPLIFSNYFQSFSALQINTVGITVLLMPKLFYLTGVLFGTLQIIGIGILTFITSSVLCLCARITKSKSYSELIEKSTTQFRWVFHFFFFMLLLGNVLIYQMFVLKNLIPTINYLFGLQYTNESSQYLLLSLFLTVSVNFTTLPFIFERKIYIVKKISTICAVGLLFSFIIIIIAYINPLYFGLDNNPVNWARVNYYDFDGFYITIGYYLLSFCFQSMVIDITSDIKPSTQFSSDLVIFYNCLSAISIYFIVSFVGYLTIYKYSDVETMNNYITYLITNLNDRSVLLYMTQFFILASVTLANIMNYIPMIRYLKRQLNSKCSQNTFQQSQSQQVSDIEINKSEQMRRQINQKKNNTIVWIGFIIVLGINLMIIGFGFTLDFFFDFVSAICGCPCIIIIPGMIYYNILKKKLIYNSKGHDLMFSYSIIFVGISLWMFSFYGLFRAYSE